MRQSARKQTIIDIVKWASGKEFSKLRNPMSIAKQEAAGITDTNLFREALKPYLKFDKDGKLTSFDYKALEKADPNTAIRFRTLVDNQANRAVTASNTIGDANLLKGTSPFWRVFFQFKDFTMRATHTQTMRAFKNGEVDDCLSFLFSLFTTASAVLMAQNVKAYATYRNENDRRKALKDISLDNKQFWINILLRTPMLSPASTGNDLLNMVGLSPLENIRTTIHRPPKKEKNILDNTDDFAGQAITQLPAVTSGINVAKTIVKPSKDLYNKGRLSKEDIRLISNTLIGRTTLPVIYLREELLRTSARQERYK